MLRSIVLAQAVLAVASIPATLGGTIHSPNDFSQPLSAYVPAGESAVLLPGSPDAESACQAKPALPPGLGSPSSGAEDKADMPPLPFEDPCGSGRIGCDSTLSDGRNAKLAAATAKGQTTFSGRVFYDFSEDGIWNPVPNPLEVPIKGWRIEIYKNGSFQGVTFSDVNGDYSFTRDLDQSLYSFREVAPGGYVGDGTPGAIWVAMTPREFTAAATAAQVQLPDCGNLSYERTVGLGFPASYWRSHQAAALLQGADPAWREHMTYWKGAPLALRRSISSYDPNASIYKTLPAPASFLNARRDFAKWVASPSNDHAGFLLSVEVGAAILNRRVGRMQFTAYIDRFQDGILVSFDDMVSEARDTLLSDPGAGMTGPLDPEQKLRQQMLAVINGFGTINNTSDPASPQTVFAPAGTPLPFASPY